MNNNQAICRSFILIVIIVLLTGCGGKPAELTATSIPIVKVDALPVTVNGAKLLIVMATNDIKKINNEFFFFDEQLSSKKTTLYVEAQIVSGNFDPDADDISLTDENGKQYSLGTMGFADISGLKKLFWTFIVPKASKSFTLHFPDGQMVKLDPVLDLVPYKEDTRSLVISELFPILGVVILLAALVLILARVASKRVKSVSDVKEILVVSIRKIFTKAFLLQLIMFLVMTGIITLGIWVRIMNVGWFLVFSFIPLILVVILHFVFQILAIYMVPKMKPSYIALILLSNLFFFLGFALQIDFGDGPNSGGLAIAVFYNYYFNHASGNNSPGGGQFDYIFMFISIGFLVALIVSWFFLLLWKPFLKPENSD